MKQPKLTQALLATSLTLTLAMTMLAPSARAELVNEQVESDAITPEQSSMEDEVVILKKKPAPAKRRVVVREQELPQETLSAYEPAPAMAMPVAAPAPVRPQASASATATATATAQSTSAAPARPSVGSTLDQGMNNKMDEVRGQFENALIRTLDRIKITVDDGVPAAAPAAAATATATATATAETSAPVVPTQVVAEPVVPSNYMPVQEVVREDREDRRRDRDREENEDDKEERAEKKDDSFLGRFRLAPRIGMTSIGSDFYDIKSSLSLGIGAEMDISDNFGINLAYTYSKFDIGLAAGNPFYGYGTYGGYGGSQLQYHQNLFELTGRLYLLPRESMFRAFVGGGIGYNTGYINYRSGYAYYSQYNQTNDYTLSQFVGVLEAGADVKVASSVSIGALFKYNPILSSRENSPLNNYGFYGYGGFSNVTQEQAVAGGSIAREGFWSILGTVNVAF